MRRSTTHLTRGHACRALATAALLGVLGLAGPVAVPTASAAPASFTATSDGTAAPSLAAEAAVSTDLDSVIEELRLELGESSEAMVRAGADLRLAEAALPGARRNAEEARRLLATAIRRQEQTALARGRAQVQLMLSQQQAEASEAAVAEQQSRIGALARAAYQGGGSLSEFSMLLEARSPADFADRLASLRTLASAQRSALTDLQTVRTSFGTRTQDLEQLRDTLAEADKAAQAELSTVMQLESQARAAEQNVAALIEARERALAAAAAAQAEDDEAAMRRDSVSSALQSQLDALARSEAGRGGARDGATVPAQAGALRWPVQGRMSSPFGMRVHPITGVYKLHTGQDVAAACGTPLLAARAGRVIDAGWNSAYGWRTVVAHGAVGGVLLTTTYNHQDSLGVAVGDRVEDGQVIGRVGSTGYSTGCHLHFEVYVNSTLVDPVPWMS